MTDLHEQAWSARENWHSMDDLYAAYVQVCAERDQAIRERDEARRIAENSLGNLLPIIAKLRGERDALAEAAVDALPVDDGG